MTRLDETFDVAPIFVAHARAERALRVIASRDLHGRRLPC